MTRPRSPSGDAFATVPADRTMEADTKPLAIWIRRFLIVAGYAIGISGSAQLLLLPVVWGSYSNFVAQHGSLKSIYVLFLIASAICPPLLLVGIWGFHQHKRWATRLLLIYAATSISAAVGLHAVSFIGGLALWRGGVSVFIRVGLGLIRFVDLIDPCIYPVLLLLCLTHLEFRNQFADFGRGFSPVLNSESLAAGDSPVPVENVGPEECS